MTVSVNYKDLGLIRYQDALEQQEILYNNLINNKMGLETVSSQACDTLFLCEHPHVITLGRSGKQENLLFDTSYLEKQGVEFYRSSRGGDITYHGPGQIVGYPVLDLEKHGLGVKAYVHALEDVIISSLDDYGIRAGRIAGMTGVWLDHENSEQCRKICALGVKISRHVSMHGFAFNVNTDLNFFNFIVPCGLTGKAVSSLEKETGKKIDIEEVKAVLQKKFEVIFNVKLVV